MRDLDHELRNALRREEPPAGFADRVFDSAAARTWDRPSRRLTRHMDFIGWATAAAILAALAGAGLAYRAVQRERAEGEIARARVVLALHIASSKLQLVHTKITRMHEQPEKNSNQ